MEKERALEILKALAAGTDPFSGETLPPESPCQQGDGVRALTIAVSRVERWRDRDLPPRAGQPWNEEEEARLVEGHEAARSIRELAEAMERTPGAVRTRLIRLGLIEA